MYRQIRIPLSDLLASLSEAMDLIDPVLVGHHKQVAYIALCLAEELGLSNKERRRIFLAASLHDIGAVSRKERLCTMKFEVDNPQEHAIMGATLLSRSQFLAPIADMIRFHHTSWEEGEGAECQGQKIPLGSHILHLADRVAVQIKPKKEILLQAPAIREKIRVYSGRFFMPGIVEAFESLCSKEYFWLDAASPSLGMIVRQRTTLELLELGIEELSELTDVFRQMIDFRSRYTATHSSGVSASAEALSRLLGFSERESALMRIAGHLHDLGKLIVPDSILEKPSGLTHDEFAVMKKHSYYTFRILSPIQDLETIVRWSAYHHERLNGKGYPFHLGQKDLSLGARIMAVADVFTAVTEDRPYRKGMNLKEAQNVLDSLAHSGTLDGDVINCLNKHVDDVEACRIRAQTAARKQYDDWLKCTESQ